MGFIDPVTGEGKVPSKLEMVTTVAESAVRLSGKTIELVERYRAALDYLGYTLEDVEELRERNNTEGSADRVNVDRLAGTSGLRKRGRRR